MSTQVLAQAISGINLPKINLRKLLISGFILITSLIIFYIFQISEITKFSFSLAKYELEISALAGDNKNLEIGISQKNSLSGLEEVLSRLNYEKVSKIYYIRILDGQVAVRP